MSTPEFDPARASARAHAAAVSSGQLTARGLCDAAIARIEQADGPINAVVVRDFDRARLEAAALDEAIARGERHLCNSPLLGVPMTVKESFNVAGLVTHWGLPPFKDLRARSDALMVERLKAAGAIILGKTNVPPALSDWQTANALHGRTCNPHDLSRTPGGSSGGSAAALAAGFVPLELGSDIGGSLRIPAHFCGVYAHKPTYGLLPTRGQAFPGTDGVPPELAVVGPMARSAADLALAMEVLLGPTAEQGVAWRTQLRPPRCSRLAGARLLMLDNHPLAATDTATRQAFAAFSARLAAEGAQLLHPDDLAPGLLPDLTQQHRHFVSMLMTIVSRGAPGTTRCISAHEWMALLDEQLRCRRAWAALFEQVDALISPPFGTAAFPHTDEPDWAQRRLMIDGDASEFGHQLAWAGLATFPGLPATVLPVGRLPHGLPLGVQILGPWGEDRTPLALAHAIELLDPPLDPDHFAVRTDTSAPAPTHS